MPFCPEILSLRILMRPAIIFSLLLCFHLWGDGNAVSGNMCNNRSAICSFNCTPQAKSQLRNTESPYSFLKPSADLPGEDDIFLFAEEDNEEEHTRKLKSSSEPVSIFFFAITVSQPSIVPANILPFYRHDSHREDCKYLAHCVLRI